MGSSAEDCEAELKQLRRNRGLCLARAGEIGDALRTACGVTSDDTPARTVQKVIEAISQQAQWLGREQRQAALTALGLSGPESRFLQDRQAWVAQAIDRDIRTARRRIDEGCAELALLLAEGGETATTPTGSWHTERMRVLLALDQPSPEAFVFRRVVACNESLDELDLATPLTASDQLAIHHADEVQVDVFAGGTLLRTRNGSSKLTGLALRPPEPLRRGQKHEIALRVRAAKVLPYYVCVPKSACAEFTLTVRFGTQPPRTVGLLEKVLRNDLRSATGTPLETDAAGEVHVRFRNLQPEFAYGIRWEP
ncbi:hypothetical protein [Saccharopolyspora shandongensis]|uniref:hypothetical protein n=1 Tax=Saccharopolyspora shandongensis TaxID=418495 RepID=UPI003404AE39